jgi:hypothetical protein
MAADANENVAHDFAQRIDAVAVYLALQTRIIKINMKISHKYIKCYEKQSTRPFDDHQ